jgi:DNA-binding NarL/FixJ family response regulator
MHIDPRPRLREICATIRRAEAMITERDQLIRQAVAYGYSEREIAKVSGLSQPRVHEIANE